MILICNRNAPKGRPEYVRGHRHQIKHFKKSESIWLPHHPRERWENKRKTLRSRNENETEKFFACECECWEVLCGIRAGIESLLALKTQNCLRLINFTKSISSSPGHTWACRNCPSHPTFLCSCPSSPRTHISTECVCKYYLEPIISVFMQLLMPPAEGEKRVSGRTWEECIRAFAESQANENAN